MSEYLKTVVAVVLVIGMISVFFSKDTISKYVEILSGIIVMAVLVFPLINLERHNIDFEILDIETLELSTNSYIMDEFEKELSENIKRKLKNETDINFSVDVYAEKDEDIIEINKIEIAPFSKEYAVIISEYLGISEGRIMQK